MEWFFWPVTNNASVEHSCMSFCVDVSFISLKYIPKSRMAGLCGNFMFNILRKMTGWFSKWLPRFTIAPAEGVFCFPVLASRNGSSLA